LPRALRTLRSSCVTILLIGGKYNAKPTNIDEFRAAHETFIAGVHTFK
jgi:hypothetical protein